MVSYMMGLSNRYRTISRTAQGVFLAMMHPVLTDRLRKFKELTPSSFDRYNCGHGHTKFDPRG
jgi:hypothetical protein